MKNTKKEQGGTNANPNELLTLNQVARTLGCSKRFVQSEIARNHLAVIRRGKRFVRVWKPDLDAYIRAARTFALGELAA